MEKDIDIAAQLDTINVVPEIDFKKIDYSILGKPNEEYNIDID
jgi:hypothetical protein